MLERNINNSNRNTNFVYDFSQETDSKSREIHSQKNYLGSSTFTLA